MCGALRGNERARGRGEALLVPIRALELMAYENGRPILEGNDPRTARGAWASVAKASAHVPTARVSTVLGSRHGRRIRATFDRNGHQRVECGRATRMRIENASAPHSIAQMLLGSIGRRGVGPFDAGTGYYLVKLGKDRELGYSSSHRASLDDEQ